MRYFFDIRCSSGFHSDDHGDELEGYEEARQMAQALLPDIVRQELPDGERHTITVSVRDDEGRVVYEGELIYRGRRFPPQG